MDKIKVFNKYGEITLAGNNDFFTTLINDGVAMFDKTDTEDNNRLLYLAGLESVVVKMPDSVKYVATLLTKGGPRLVLLNT